MASAKKIRKQENVEKRERSPQQVQRDGDRRRRNTMAREAVERKRAERDGTA